MHSVIVKTYELAPKNINMEILTLENCIRN